MVGIKTVKINYMPIVPNRKSEVAYEVSYEHIYAVEKAMEIKAKKNAIESSMAYIEAKNYVVKGTNNSKRLVKKK